METSFCNKRKKIESVAVGRAHVRIRRALHQQLIDSFLFIIFPYIMTSFLEKYIK